MLAEKRADVWVDVWAATRVEMMASLMASSMAVLWVASMEKQWGMQSVVEMVG